MSRAKRLRATTRERAEFTPPISQRLGLLAQVLDELSGVAAIEPDPVRANKLRGLAHRLGVALAVNHQYLVEQPAAWNKAIASRDRPEARSVIRQKIVAIMVSGHRAGMQFKAFLRHWEQGPIDGVRLSFDGVQQHYVAADEDADEDDDAGHGHYKLAYLRKLYSTCKPR